MIFYIYLSLPEGNLQNVADVSRVQRQPNWCPHFTHAHKSISWFLMCCCLDSLYGRFELQKAHCIHTGHQKANPRKPTASAAKNWNTVQHSLTWHVYIYIYMIWVLARSLQKMTFLDSLRLLNMLCWAAQSMCSPTGLRDSPTLGHLRTKSGTTPFSERWKGYHPKNSYWNYWSWHFQPRRLVQIPRTGVAAIDYH